MTKYARGFAVRVVSLLAIAAAGVTTCSAAPRPRPVSGSAPQSNTTHQQSAASAKTQQANVSHGSSQPAGVWSPPVEVGVVAIHMALLRTGKVLLWGTPGTGMIGCCTLAKLVDPVANTVTDVTQPFPADVICAAQTILPDGRVITSGGNGTTLGDGITTTTLFDPLTQTWSLTGDMSFARWYPTNIQMPDGSTLVVSGLDQNHQNLQRQMEDYNSTTGAWTALPTTADLPDTSAAYTYQHLFLLPNGKIMEAGPWRTTSIYDPVAGTWSRIGNMSFGDRYHAAAVLMPDLQTVLIAGGTPVNVEGSSAATATIETIDLTASQPTWQYGPSMNLARYNENLVYLADGTLFAVGGGQGPTKYANPIYQSELYDPVAQTWTLMASQQGNRTYHSTAALLPDGRVISTGSTNGTPQSHMFEIFSPPYLFNGTRPTYSGNPNMIHYGRNFTIKTAATNITKVALIRPSATTHADDMDQRYVPLSFTQGTGSLSITAPVNANSAPPGFYMLVIVNSNGVPSKMRFLQLM